jgi:hypothetical protein
LITSHSFLKHRRAVGFALPKLREGDALFCRSYALRRRQRLRRVASALAEAYGGRWKAMQDLLLRHSRLRRRSMAREACEGEDFIFWRTPLIIFIGVFINIQNNII